MASVLKRKRGSLEVEESSKRSRSTKEKHGSAPELLDPSKVEWDAAFGPIQRHNGTAHGINREEVMLGARTSNSPEAEDFQDMLERAQVEEERKKREEMAFSKVPTWKISDPIGGRIIEVDPVFTEEEK